MEKQQKCILYFEHLIFFFISRPMYLFGRLLETFDFVIVFLEQHYVIFKINL